VFILLLGYFQFNSEARLILCVFVCVRVCFVCYFHWCRCSEAERQVASYRDLEGGMLSLSDSAAGDGEDGFAGSGGSSSGGGGGLNYRRGGGRSGGHGGAGGGGRDTKVISDLERFGVKPGAHVTHAVNMVDSWTMFTVRYVCAVCVQCVCYLSLSVCVCVHACAFTFCSSFLFCQICCCSVNFLCFSVYRILHVYPLARFAFLIYLVVLHLWVLLILVMQTHTLELDADISLKEQLAQ
jgi:hypothetical protein